MATSHRGRPRKSLPLNVKEGEIEVATLIEHLRPERDHEAYVKRGLETWAVDWSPDGHYLAWSQGNKFIELVPWNKYKHCRLAQDNTNYQGQRINIQQLTFNAGSLVWSLALGPRDSTLYPLEYDSHKKHLVLDTRKLVLAVGAMCDIKLWSVHTGEMMYLIAHHHALVRDVQFSPGGSQHLLAGSRDGTLSVWDLGNDVQLLKTFRGNSDWIYACAWSPNSDIVCGVGDKNMVTLWELKGEGHWQLEGHSACVTCCDFSPDGALLATSSFDTTVIIWDPHKHTRLKTLHHCFVGSEPVTVEQTPWYVRHLAFSWDSRYLVSICEDRLIRFWDFASPELPKQVALVNNPLCCAFSPDGLVLAVGNRNGQVTIWLSIAEIPTLQHLCRMSIRKVLHSSHLDHLHMPNKIRRYLKYFDESQINFQESVEDMSMCPSLPDDGMNKLDKDSEGQLHKSGSFETHEEGVSNVGNIKQFNGSLCMCGSKSFNDALCENDKTESASSRVVDDFDVSPTCNCEKRGHVEDDAEHIRDS